jgi:mono/diheme cytochrome c family protein
MRGSQWRLFGTLVVVTMALSACGGDAGDAGADMEETAAADVGSPAAAEQPAQEQAMNLPDGVTQDLVAQGRQLFTGQGGCHACHGPQGKGTQLAPDLTDATWINVKGRNLPEIEALIKTGVQQPKEHPAPMPPMGGASLSDQQVKALAAYVVSISAG